MLVHIKHLLLFKSLHKDNLLSFPLRRLYLYACLVLAASQLSVKKKSKLFLQRKKPYKRCTFSNEMNAPHLFKLLTNRIFL